MYLYGVVYVFYRSRAFNCLLTRTQNYWLYTPIIFSVVKKKEERYTNTRLSRTRVSTRRSSSSIRRARTRNKLSARRACISCACAVLVCNTQKRRQLAVFKPSKVASIHIWCCLIYATKRSPTQSIYKIKLQSIGARRGAATAQHPTVRRIVAMQPASLPPHRTVLVSMQARRHTNFMRFLSIHIKYTTLNYTTHTFVRDLLK